MCVWDGGILVPAETEDVRSHSMSQSKCFLPLHQLSSWRPRGIGLQVGSQPEKPATDSSLQACGSGAPGVGHSMGTEAWVYPSVWVSEGGSQPVTRWSKEQVRAHSLGTGRGGTSSIQVQYPGIVRRVALGLGPTPGPGILCSREHPCPPAALGVITISSPLAGSFTCVTAHDSEGRVCTHKPQLGI